MNSVYTMHKVDDQKVKEVADMMVKMGAPVIKAVNCINYILPIEGMHRLRAAAKLGLMPVFELIELDEEINISEMDIRDMFRSDVVTGSDLAEELYHNDCGCYEIIGDEFNFVFDAR